MMVTGMDTPGTHAGSARFALINRREFLAGSGAALLAKPTQASEPGKRFGVADVSNDVAADLTNAVERFRMYRDLGFEMLRTEIAWSHFEKQKGEWSIDPTRARYFALAAQNGLSLKLVINIWNGAPGWFFQENPGARLVNGSGQPPHGQLLSVWYPNVANLIIDKQNHLVDELKRLGILDNTGAVIAGLGPAAEPIYPAAWEVSNAKEDTFWFYGKDARSSFASYTKKKYSGNIQTANGQWGTRFMGWEDVAIPEPHAKAGPLWLDVLLWYRDSKRNVIRPIVHDLNGKLSQVLQGRRIPLVVLDGGSHYSPADFQQAVNNGDGSTPIRLMVDTDFMLELAGQERVDIQYTAAANEGEIAYIAQFLRSRNIGSALWLENAGGPAAKAAFSHVVANFTKYRCHGLDLINAALFVDQAGQPNDFARNVKGGIDLMKRYAS